MLIPQTYLRATQGHAERPLAGLVHPRVSTSGFFSLSLQYCNVNNCGSTSVRTSNLFFRGLGLKHLTGRPESLTDTRRKWSHLTLRRPRPSKFEIRSWITVTVRQHSGNVYPRAAFLKSPRIALIQRHPNSESSLDRYISSCGF